jgi:hypothetical protein
MKVCSKCRVEKPKGEFYAHKRGKDGLFSDCKVCVKARANAYADANREKVRLSNREAGRKFRAAHVDAERARIRRFYIENKAAWYARSRAWANANPHKRTAAAGRYRATKLKATPKWANAHYINMFYELAAQETERLGAKVHVDRIVPLNSDVVCGLHCEQNLQLLPAAENIRKSNRYWPDAP